ncbi:hypothetical protein DFP73DRAFT_628018 [Morchella snyderi]|nr:hypothetical protein DFP73DRAFT_628018 [Morchella snyderi]
MAFKKNPSPWSKGPFFGLRALQFIFATIVSAIASYFNYTLDADGYEIPWVFLIVEVVSALTYLNIFASSIFMCCNKLSPLFMMITDAILVFMWVFTFAMLSRAMGRTTTETCDIANWGSDAGIVICHMYKCLFAFVFLSWVMHVASTVLASTVRRKVNTHAYEPAANPGNFTESKSGLYNPGAESIRSVDTSYNAPTYTAGNERSYA